MGIAPRVDQRVSFEFEHSNETHKYKSMVIIHGNIRVVTQTHNMYQHPS